MADEPAATPAVARKGTNFLTRKVGPLPVIAWAAIIITAYWLYQRYQSGGSSNSALGPVDPQTGLPYSSEAIDPATGVPYAQELGAAQASSGNGTTTATTPGQFADNDQWSTAAINYLVGRGIDPSVASQAVENYLGSISQPNPQYQADVNMAITALGPPPQIPGPAPTNPTPVGSTTGTGSTAQVPPVSPGNSQYQTHNYTADGTLTLAQIASRNHNATSAVDTLNPGLYQKYGNSKKIPKGTNVTLPYKR